MARLALEFVSLERSILNDPNFRMLKQTTDLRKKFGVIDVEFSSVPLDLPEPSVFGPLVLFQVCVKDYHSEETLLDELVNFLPDEYAHDPLGYLRKVNPKNSQRALESLGRVHKMTVADTAECNSALAERLRDCSPIAEITADLAAIARELQAKDGRWVAYGDSPEPGLLKKLQLHCGPAVFPPIEVLNGLAILRFIATHTRGKYYKDGEPSTKVPCSLGGAYAAMTGAVMPDAHIASGDCIGTIRVLKGIQECRERCEAKSR